MSFVYSSNSPEFLNYLAHTKTRNDILNDPRLCILLEDPHIKDNMELALLYREAQYGDYEKKKEFIGFLLANGPEIDTDTIMYYREKILHNSTYNDIYIKEFKYNMEVVDDLRINTYKKDTTETNPYLNCLSNPCDYLGPFSSSIGIMADDRNFNTLSNFFASWSPDSGNFDGDVGVGGTILMSLYHKLLPDLASAWSTLKAATLSNVNDLAKSLHKFNKSLPEPLSANWDYTEVIGDKNALENAKETSTAVRVNIVSNLGDCYRIWESMRRLRVYDPSKNNKNSFTQVGPKTGDGTQNTVPNAPNNTILAPSSQSITGVAMSGVTSVEVDDKDTSLSPSEKRWRSLSRLHREAYQAIQFYLTAYLFDPSTRNLADGILDDTWMTFAIDYLQRIDNYVAGEIIFDDPVFAGELPLEREIPDISGLNGIIGSLKSTHSSEIITYMLNDDGSIDIRPNSGALTQDNYNSLQKFL